MAGRTNTTAYRYRIGDAAVELLGILPPYARSRSLGISGDGEVVVGVNVAGMTEEFGQAFRWTSTTGMVGLGYLAPGQAYSEATAISRDGSTIVGYVRQTTAFNQAFVWRDGTGMVGLPGLDSTNDGRARAVNFTGTIVVGSSRPAQFVEAATMWVGGMPTNLGIPPGFIRSRAFGVNDDGSVVVGQLDGGPFGQTAAIWTPARGMEPLSAYLAHYGIAVPPGINLITATATAVSADGMTIAGYGPNANGDSVGFVAHIPAPGTFIIFTLACLVRRRRA